MIVNKLAESKDNKLVFKIISKELKEIEPGTRVFTENEGPNIVKVEKFDPVTHELMDADYYRKQKQIAERKREEEARAPYTAVQKKLDDFRIAWEKKPLSSIATLNETIDEFIEAFNTAQADVREELEQREFPQLARHLSKYKFEIESVLSFVNNLLEINKEQEEKKKKKQKEECSDE
ncbi:MAG: hypothetical protein M3114_08555 [Thermoproteota archaeon]|nr:hypothetical protein [Thermoproteota archaeon]